MDKDKIHIDEEFLDQSWANMSQILDQEMPIKKRKRRFIWLWLSGLMALAFVVIVYANSNNFTETDALPIPVKEKTSNENKEPKVADNQLIDLKKEDHQNTQISKSTKSPDIPRLINTIKNLTLANPSESVSLPSNSEDGILQVGSSTSSKLITQENKLDNSILIDIKNSANKSLENSKLVAENRLLLADFSPISTLDFHPIFEKNSSILFPTFSVKNQSNWQFGAYAGKIYPKFGSFRAGLHAQKVINQKWSLYIGFGYARRVAKDAISQEEDNNADVEVLQAPVGIPEEDNMMDGAGITLDPSVNTMIPQVSSAVNISFQNFHYFELPILIQYQLNHRWSIEIGGQISKLYGYTYQDLNTNVSNFNTDLSGSFSNFDRSISVDQGILEIAAWDFAALGGAAFKVNSQFQIYSNYRLGLNNYLTVNTEPLKQKKWRQIELGVRYYFK